MLMAATDQRYRPQKTLDIVFAASCAGLLLSTIWMFVQDYNRDFKAVQRTFRDVESTLAERDMVNKLPDPEVLKDKLRELTEARRKRDLAGAAVKLGREEFDEKYATLRDRKASSADRESAEAELKKAQEEFVAEERKLIAERERLDEKYREIKAEYDALMSYYNIATDNAGREFSTSPRVKVFQDEAQSLKKRLDELEGKELPDYKGKLDKVDRDMRKLREPIKPYEDEAIAAEEDLKKLNAATDRYAKVAAQRAWSVGDAFRALPILDGFESPLKIKQIWLPDLTIDYSFREVPRYDRCTTCHLGIDRAGLDRPALAKLGDEEESRRLISKLTTAQEMYKERQQAGEKLSFDPNDLPGERSGSFGLMLFLLLASSLIAAGSLAALERSWRLGTKVMAAGMLLSVASAAAIAWMAPKTPTIKTIKLTEGQITQYSVHPRLDLFVDSNSPHSVEKFGCTICHGGQGSATEFTLASHTPSDSRQLERWQNEHHYHSSHYWDYPMLSKRFTESSCLKCHHQVTDLVRQGSKEEAPKVLRGFNLVKEAGCFGCHEIQGTKGGRSIGPDLRLEPSPALDYLTAADQERIRSDPANPPGGMRKVGPSLRRLTEKTDEEWTQKWIASPRGFRPDTKMPHFYGLNNNTKEALPEDQKQFPAAEMRAISHYLIAESKAHLSKDGDAYRQALLKGGGESQELAGKGLRQLEKELTDKGLDDRAMKELLDLTRRFVDVALLSVPMNASEINQHATRMRQAQDRLHELWRRNRELENQAETGAAPAAKVKDETDALKDTIDRTGKELTSARSALDQASRPRSIAERMVNGEGQDVKFPEKAGDANTGRMLFSERGCLACHTHQGTTKEDATVKIRDEKEKKDRDTTISKVISDATFGPNLSQLVAKLKPSMSGVDNRRWLVQWLLNPNVYHPRTRMPITHLSVEDANNIAAWLLSQSADWQVAAVDSVSGKDYRKLARVYLAKAPGITRAELDSFLPEDESKPVGIPKSRLARFPRDAEERRLEEGTFKDEETALQWYIGKKAIGRLGCFGCHDIPGFETAKSIGTGLNDWGKKDPERLAFEDAEAFARLHMNIVPTTMTRQDVERRQKELEDKDESRQTKAERDELKRIKKQLNPDVQKKIRELEAKAQKEDLTSSERAELAELQPLKFFEAGEMARLRSRRSSSRRWNTTSARASSTSN